MPKPTFPAMLKLNAIFFMKRSLILSQPEAIFLFLDSLNTYLNISNGIFYLDIVLFLLHFYLKIELFLLYRVISVIYRVISVISVLLLKDR